MLSLRTEGPTLPYRGRGRVSVLKKTRQHVKQARNGLCSRGTVFQGNNVRILKKCILTNEANICNALCEIILIELNQQEANQQPRTELGTGGFCNLSI